MTGISARLIWPPDGVERDARGIFQRWYSISSQP
jgi:hypothetical protein